MHLNVPKEINREIEEKLVQGVSRTRILRDLKATVQPGTAANLVNSRTIKNIFDRMKKANGTQLSDWSSTTEIAREMEQNGTLLLFQLDNKEPDSILFGFMTEAQSQMLTSHGHRGIYMDSTHGVAKYKVQLTTLMVVDLNGYSLFNCIK